MSILKAKNKQIQQSKPRKKIGFFGAMLVVMGSSIGAGIFLKSKAVLDGSQGSLVLAIFCWVFAGFAVISMALSLIEISSASKNNLSLIGWCKIFNSAATYKAAKNFMLYIYSPLTYFFMPLYAILQFQDGLSAFGIGAIGTKVDWLIISIIAFLISAYFIFVSGYSSFAGNIQNIIIMSVKFIPLIVGGVIGFVFVGLEGGSSISASPIPTNYYNVSSFSALTPGFGMFVAVGGIFFAFDGFYVTAGIQSELKEPKKSPKAILYGLVLVTVIYLIVAISMSLNGNGNFYGFGDWLATKNASWVFGVTNFLIAFGILGIINGFAMWTPRFIEDLIIAGEIPFLNRWKAHLNPHRPIVGILFSLVIYFPIAIIFTLIGALGYIDASGYGATTYGFNVNRLYSFADLMSNWTSVIAFAYITIAIFGGILNRKHKKIATAQTKFFLPMAIASVICVGISLLFTIATPIFNLFMLYGWINDTSRWLGQEVSASLNVHDLIISTVLTVVVLALFLMIMYLPPVINNQIMQYNKARKRANKVVQNKL